MFNVDIAKKNAYANISNAMMLDSLGKHQDTYRSYTSCIEMMTYNLALDAKDVDIKISETTIEFIFLSLKCLERLKVLAQSLLKEKLNKENNVVTNNEKPNNVADKTVERCTNINYSDLNSKNISPLQLATNRNKILLQNLETKLLNSKFSSYESTTMKLALERKMAENLALADKQETLISKKRLESINNHLKSDLFKNEEEKQFFCDVLNFESKHAWLQNLRKTDQKEFSDNYFVENSIRLILGNSCHLISMFLNSEKEIILKNIKQLIDENTLNAQNTTTDDLLNKCNDIMRQLKQLHSNLQWRFVIVYESFKNQNALELLFETLEQYVYDTSTWAQILKLYRLTTIETEENLISVFNRSQTISLEDCGINGSYMLVNESKPYQDTIDKLSTVFSLPTPTKRINCIVDSIQQICQSYKEYCNLNKIESLGIGADELVPLLIFIIVRLQSPQLLTHCYALLDFLDEKSSIGEEGYCLTTLLTAFDSVFRTIPLK